MAGISCVHLSRKHWIYHVLIFIILNSVKKHKVYHVRPIPDKTALDISRSLCYHFISGKKALN